ncbi:MAG: tRNA lysidine(34) synthetase TilS [Acidimicrobiia bacterium]|nr:MAG: tRNA lysidine(34) synthetase TilS [Acidimicrobiia bacterium]
MAETRRLTPAEFRDRVAKALPDVPIAVALGGGADSAVAAWLSAQQPRVRGIFVNHGLEGSADLKAAALALADRLELVVTVLDAPVEGGGNLESRARTARWQAIDADRGPGESVVTGHSQDDLAETLLMNLLRGAGAHGIGAMAAPRSDILRPLLHVSRAELRRLAEELGLPFADDPANEDPAHLRNRIRADLIPLLERDYRHGVRATLARAGFLAATDDAALDEAAAEITVIEEDGAALVPTALLNTVSLPVAARAIRRALRRVHPPYAGSAADVDAVLAVARGDNRRTTLSGGVMASLESPYVALWVSEPIVPESAPLHIKSSVRFGRRLITAVSAGGAGLSRVSTVLVDPAVFDAGLIVRPAGIGERIEIEHGTKLIREVLAEAAVPVRRRPAWPVLANDAKIAAVVAGRVAPWARPSGDSAVAVTEEWL